MGMSIDRRRAVGIAAALVAASAAGWWALRLQASPPPAAAPPTPPAHVAEAVFAPTLPNPGGAPGPAPAGMVWIPGGEFSMGAVDPRHVEHGGHEAMEDTRPIHRVYVD